MAWKEQLHFILCGAFSVIGIVLLVLAVSSKGAAATTLEDAKKKLDNAAKGPGNGPLPTRKDLDDAIKRQQSFQKEVTDFENKLRTDIGERLRSVRRDYAETSQFYADEVVPKLKDYRARLDALKKEPALPARFQPSGDPDKPNPNEKKFGALPSSERFWTDFDRVMISLQPTLIRLAQAQLKLMGECVAVLEALRNSEQFKDSMFIFEKFEFQNFAGEPVKDGNTPWQRRDFGISFVCEPSFALAFVQEMCAPSERTKAEGKRAFVPVELVQIFAEALPRPHDVTYTVTNEERKVWGIGSTETTSDLSEIKQRQISDGLSESEKLVMPLRYTVRMQALELNGLWNVIATQN